MLRLDHVNILTRDPVPMIAFFEKVIGVTEGHRPPFPFPGHWLYLDGHPVIHLNIVARTDDFPAGMFNQVAFSFYDRETALKALEDSGYRFELDAIPDTDIGQIFVYGPEGVKIELQFRL